LHLLGARFRLCSVLVLIFGIGASRLLGDELRVMLLERIGDVLNEDEPEDDVLIPGGIHSAA
jgi:hypothetical protein